METDKDISYSKHYLYPGSIYSGADPCVVTTLLGSCISVCLWDRELRVGGINHFIFPYWNGEGLPSPRYGNIAIQKLIERMRLLGCNRKNLQAKVFGGASILSVNSSFMSVGERNAELAFNALGSEGITVVKHSVGGTCGRKIMFDTFTGRILLKNLRPHPASGIFTPT